MKGRIHAMEIFINEIIAKQLQNLSKEELLEMVNTLIITQTNFLNMNPIEQSQLICDLIEEAKDQVTATNDTITPPNLEVAQSSTAM
jgi:hypothetical protein